LNSLDRSIPAQADGPASDPGAYAWWSPRADNHFARAWLRESSQKESEGKAAFISVVVFTFILLLSPQDWFPPLRHLRIAFLAAGGATAILLWDRWKQREPLLNLRRELLVATVLIAWAVLTLPLSYWPGGSMNVLTEEYVKSVVILWLLANAVTTAKRLRFVAVTLMLCSLPLALTVLKNYMAGNFFGTGSERVIGYQSALGNPNDMALMLNLIIPSSIAMFLGASRPFVRILCVAVVGINVLGVILTFSRAGFLGLATIGVLYLARLVRREEDRKWAFTVLALLVLSVPMLPSSYFQRISTITDIDADASGSAQARWRDNLAALKFIRGHPIVGAGIGQDILALNDVRGSKWVQVHNVYLEYGVDLGLPGLVLFVVLCYGAWKASHSSRQQTASVPTLRHLCLLAEGVEVSVIVFAVAGFFHPVAYHFYFYYIAGLAIATRSVTNHEMSMINDFDDSAGVVEPLAFDRGPFVAHVHP
jgi:hypothetical protein